MSKIAITLSAAALFVALSLSAVSGGFNIDEYFNFLDNNKNIDYKGIDALYPIGLYQKTACIKTNKPAYFDSICNVYHLTDFEKQLLENHSFMVSERLKFDDFTTAYASIFKNDLPVFISTDAILHAVHRSYDKILMDVETSYIIPELTTLLTGLRDKLPAKMNAYGGDEILRQSVIDADLYFAIALRLLSGDGSVQPLFQENSGDFSNLLNYIGLENYISYPLFSEEYKDLDFSQFKVRGHYTESEELSRYFRSMMWLGRTEFYLIPPSYSNQTEEDIRRQTINSALILELFDENLRAMHSNIDQIITALVGESDNVQLYQLQEVLTETGITSLDQLTSLETCAAFRETLTTKSYCDQKILSQIVLGSPFERNKIKPASAFLLFGQKFIIDSYIFCNVVFDRVPGMRMLPSSYDMLFALGNNAALDFLKGELETYKYYKELTGLRYLIDTYDDSFWYKSFYNSWLNAIRTLNPLPEAEIQKLPRFMRTAAWQQEKMNTQLASWAELRHDNLLYAKPSYTGGVICEYPFVYVEPNPAFFEAIIKLSNNTLEKILSISSMSGYEYDYYFQQLKETAEKLKSAAEKELHGENLTESEIAFLKGLYFSFGSCGGPEDAGWYINLLYNSDPHRIDFLVADIHTAPTDANGNIVGWVQHVGTGPINLGVFVVEQPNGSEIAYVGPVSSYYEYTSSDFYRCSDEEWRSGILYSELTLRPQFVDLYLANYQGYSRNPIPLMLPTDVEDDFQPAINSYLTSSYPNPASESVLISIVLPQNLPISNLSLDIYDLQGYRVRTLFNGMIQGGNYVFKWDGFASDGSKAADGVYLYKFNVNGKIVTGKLVISNK